MATWVFVATLSWLIVATIGFVASVLLAMAIWFAIEPAAIVALTAVAFPIAFAHGILTRTSSSVGVLASLYAFALAGYIAAEIGPSTALIVLCGSALYLPWLPENCRSRTGTPPGVERWTKQNVRSIIDRMTAEYREEPCRSALNRVSGM